MIYFVLPCGLPRALLLQSVFEACAQPCAAWLRHVASYTAAFGILHKDNLSADTTDWRFTDAAGLGM